MLNPAFTDNTPLPQPGSTGYLRGTAQKARVLRRDAARQTCLVQLFHRPRGFGEWLPVEGASGNREVEQRDLYPTAREATFCGKPPKGRRTRARRA